MSDRVGFLNYAGENSREMFLPEKEYSDETARVIDEEVRRIVDAAFDDCNRLVERHWDEVTAVAEALLRYETISADDVDRLMKGEKISKPTVAELLAAETESTPPRPQQPTSEDEDEGLGDVMPSPA